MASVAYRPGDWVIYRKSKFSRRPGARARNISAAAHGDEYAYTVDKFWIVAELLDEGRVRLVTRRGKQHICAASDSQLHRARWWERLKYRRRFRDVEHEPRPTLDRADQDSSAYAAR